LLLEQHGKVLFESRFQTPPEIANEVISLAQMATLSELQPNLYEKNHRRLLDFGHSFSPKIESESRFTLAHGEAVAVDMLLSTYIACSKALCSIDVLNRLIVLYRIFNLPLQYSASDAKTLLQGLDEICSHRGGNLNLVVPTGVGKTIFLQQQEIALTDIETGLDFLNSIEINVSNSN
jgi:3-dehydroquinate synthase